jgi:hypothetical protein
MVGTLWSKYHEIIMLALVKKNGLRREFVTCVKLGLTWIINKSNKWFNIWSWKPAFQLELIQNSNTNMNLSNKKLGADKGWIQSALFISFTNVDIKAMWYWLLTFGTRCTPHVIPNSQYY